jgi:hypothetical protein
MDASQDQNERHMHFRISGLEPTQFTHLFHLSEEELASHNILRYVVTDKPGFPCRVSLQDAELGAKVLLLNYTHMDTTTPYRASHAIFVRENATPAKLDIDEIPDSVRNRPMSVRAFDAQGMMLDADVVDGKLLEPVLQRLFGNTDVEFVHLHNAMRGCYAARVDREPK